MESSTIITSQKESGDEVASSTIKRDIQRHMSAAEDMISSIRDELFTPPGSSNNIQSLANDIDDKSLYDDDGTLGDEIQRLASVEDDIRQDLATAKPKTIDIVRKEERNGLVFFVLVAIWVIVYIKQWIEYNYPNRIEAK